MLESLFEFFFKYRLSLFLRGDISFGVPWPIVLIGIAVVVVAVPTVLQYRDVRGNSSALDRVLLTAIRTSALLLVLFGIFKPQLVLSAVVPKQSFIAILLDDSQSMRIGDMNGQSRGDFVLSNFGSESSTLIKKLSEKFVLRYFRFSESIERVTDATTIPFGGKKTHVTNAVNRVTDELASVPLAGIVVVSDGVDNSGKSLSESLDDLQSRNIPVSTIGVGVEKFNRDIEVSRVEAPRSVLRGSSLMVDVTISHRGFEDETVQLNVEDEGRIVASREVKLSANDVTMTEVHFKADAPGARVFSFEVPTRPNELLSENNRREQLIYVKNERLKILYFEGEPRFELKFIRRAVEDDASLQVICLQRTADNKFLRLDVDNANDLLGGFPKTREELFHYDGLIIGSVEASYFTHDQLKMIGDFVNQRGGGLLVLGGRLSFSEGGYRDTPLADVLPLVLPPVSKRYESEGSGSGTFFSKLLVQPTPKGMAHAVTQFSTDSETNYSIWQNLPPLSTLNLVEGVKPGATTLLVGSGKDVKQQPVLAFQRYGRGISIALTISDSWQWQMHHKMPLEDMTHELFWRKLLRWLVNDVPKQVTVTTEKSRYVPGNEVSIVVEVQDERFLKVNNAEVSVGIRAPSGDRITLPMEWTLGKDGEYRASFFPEETGIYQLSASALFRGVDLGTGVGYTESGETMEEYFQAELHTTLLKEIADATDGRFYSHNTVAMLPEDLNYAGVGTTVHEKYDLWDMPVIFIFFLGSIGTEWTYRKYRGLP